MPDTKMRDQKYKGEKYGKAGVESEKSKRYTALFAERLNL